VEVVAHGAALQTESAEQATRSLTS
jgi:hypothetical protein